MRVDVLLETFGSPWSEVRDAALSAERAGLDGVWLNDHLAGSVQGAPHVLECWTVLSALAALVPRIAIGPLVLNIANRDAGTLAVMAATLQQTSAGRLLLGLGAGARAGSSYVLEQEALGRSLPTGPERRLAVERTISTLRQVWTGSVSPASGFLRPEPVPPIVVAASGPKMAELAGRVGDGICAPAGPMCAELIALARRTQTRSGGDRFLVTVSLPSVPASTEPWAGLGVDRLIVYVARPLAEGVARLQAVVGHSWS